MVKASIVSLCAVLSLCPVSAVAQVLPKIADFGMTQLSSFSIYQTEDEETLQIYPTYQDGCLSSVSYADTYSCNFSTSPLVFNYTEDFYGNEYKTCLTVLSQNEAGCVTSFKWKSEVGEPILVTITYNADNHITSWNEEDPNESSVYSIQFTWENGSLKSGHTSVTYSDNPEENYQGDAEFFYTDKQNNGIFISSQLIDPYYDRYAMTFAGLLGAPSAGLPDYATQKFTDGDGIYDNTIYFEYENDDQGRITHVKTLANEERALMYDEHYYYPEGTGIDQVTSAAVPQCRKSADAIELLQHDGSKIRYDYFGRRIK